MKRGSALLSSLFIIAVLSLIALAFATEAHLQAGINVYVRERNRVNRLTDAGQVLGEVVLVGYPDAKDWAEDEDLKKLFEEDRWFKEKRALKSESKCKIGPILIDEENPDSGTVSVEIEMVNGGEKGGLNVNELYEASDSSYRLRWEMMLQSHGLPLDYEVETDEGRLKLADMLIASWNDWRDEDDTVTTIDGVACGAEKDWYKEWEEDNKVADEDKKRPRNGSIPDVQELSYIRGFRDYPQILTGGVLNPDDRKEDQIHVRGIVDMLGVLGTAKVNANSCTVDQLLTIPGIFQEDDDEEMLDSRALAEAIVGGLATEPDNYEGEIGRSWWPYADWNDLNQRMSEVSDVNVRLGSEAGKYLVFKPAEDTVFKIKITGESMGMTHSVNAKGYVKDKKVRYIEWRED